MPWSSPHPRPGGHVLPTAALVFSFQMAEQLMTLAYDNGINLFDTAEVYAAGKYVSFLVGTMRCGPQLPWEEPVLWSLVPSTHKRPSHSACFFKLRMVLEGVVFLGPKLQDAWTLATR